MDSDLYLDIQQKLNLMLRRRAQKAWMEKNGKTVEDFIALFGRNYLE